MAPPLSAQLTPAQSNAIFNLTNRTAQATTNAPTPPTLLTAQTPAAVPPVPAQPAGETLYNGIVLPPVWPPKGEYKPGEPMPVPYLSNPPPVIDISNGRQLFVDNFLFRGRRNGYFVDVGAYDGVTYSNTCFLERELGWQGVCFEANPRAYAKLAAALVANLLSAEPVQAPRGQGQIETQH